MNDYDIAHHSIQCEADKIDAQVFTFPSVLTSAGNFVDVRVLAHTEEQARQMLPEYRRRISVCPKPDPELF